MKKLDKLILAIDSDNFNDIQNLINELCPPIKIVKIGPISFLNNYQKIIEFINEKNISIMFDFKFFDIPNTMSSCINFMFSNNIEIFTIHALSGEKAISEVKKNLVNKEQELEQKSPKMFAVTVLTSFDQNDLDSLNFKGDISDNVLNLAEKSIKSGVDGLVCSGDEIGLIRKNFGHDVEILVPGVRFNTQLNDQSRVISPREAIDLGANYIVLGRTVTDCSDMKKQLDDIIKTLD